MVSDLRGSVSEFDRDNDIMVSDLR